MMESAAGLAFLAASDAASRHTIVDLCLKEQGARANLGQLATRLTETRNRGYGLWHSAEKVTQIAVPVLVRRRPVAVLAVRYYSSALPLARAVAAFLPELKTCAGDIGRALETPVR
jgi:DNA-binding IclR family transcriptional regulator